MINRILRTENINKRLIVASKDSERATYPVRNWQGDKTLNPKIIRIEIKNLMYRIENSRTEIQQLAYLRQHPELSKDIFKDPESETAQLAQEEILNEINNEAGQDFFNDLEERGQNEPAIITKTFWTR